MTKKYTCMTIEQYSRKVTRRLLGGAAAVAAALDAESPLGRAPVGVTGAEEEAPTPEEEELAAAPDDEAPP